MILLFNDDSCYCNNSTSVSVYFLMYTFLFLLMILFEIFGFKYIFDVKYVYLIFMFGSRN